MIRKFTSLIEKDNSGHLKTVYAVVGVKNREAAFAEVARHKKQSLINIKLTHSASLGIIYEDNLYGVNHADQEVLNNGTKCWAVRIKNG